MNSRGALPGILHHGAVSASRERAILAAAIALLVLAGCDGGTDPDPPDGPRVEDFKQASECGGCHPNHFAEWSASMHAYSFHDPLFFAMNAREQMATGGALGGFCVSCHSPIGFVTGATDGMTDPMLLPPVVRDGVSCEVCHTLVTSPDSLLRAGEGGGRFFFEPGGGKKGPMDQVIPNTFHASIQDHLYDRSDVCMPCHNLSLRGVRFEGTFDEWNESAFAVSKECQDCHMPEYSGQAALNGPIRENLHRHYFTGVDIAMTPFPGRADQRARVEALLRDTATLGVHVPPSVEPAETLQVRITVANDRTGHSLPSGTTFERQMWLEVILTNYSGQIIYASGDLDANGDLRDAHSEIDPGGDEDLSLWTSRLTHPSGDPEVTVFRATGIVEQTIPTDETHERNYGIAIPSDEAGPFTLSVRLLFRPFPPYKMRSLGLEALLSENPVFEMNRYEGTIVTP